MKIYQTSDLRNIAIAGHASCGKTMLAECMALCGGVINRLGSTAGGSTISDYRDEEHARQISTQASMLNMEWQGKKINFFDTPGYLDFFGDTLSLLHVVDLAVVVVHANHGVGVGTGRVWDTATADDIPKAIVVNAMDKENTDIDALLASLREQFGKTVFPFTYPVNPGPGFNKILDVLDSKVVTYKDNTGKPEETDADASLKDKLSQFHNQLMELVAESDDKLLEKFFDKGSLTEEEVHDGLHPALMNHGVIPLFVTSAENNIGVTKLLDFVAKYGGYPGDHAKAKAVDNGGNPVAVALTDPDPTLFVFKTSVEAQFGELAYFKVMSGLLKVGADLFNYDKQTSERIGQIYILNGKARVPVNELCAGDIGAVVKLKDTHANHTLCGSKRPVSFTKIQFPKPNIHASLILHSKGDEDKVAQGLAALHNEDPTFSFLVDSELHQTVISAQGELHLDVMAGRLKARYKLNIELAQPKIAYRETIKGRGDSKYRHKKQTGGSGQFAEVWMRIEPKARDTGVEFTQTLVGQNVDRTFVPSVEKGVKKACAEGIIAGYKVVDVKIEFYDGKMHPVDSKDIAFQIAGYFAFKESFQQAKPCMLEPINSVEIRIPEDCMGNVMGDLSSRRGKIQGMDSAGGFQIIKALVPAKDLYRYSSTLRSLTGGRGVHSEAFDHYEEMPREMEAHVIEEAKKRKVEGEKVEE
ncbi:MAG: elongation factor G [Verrucomicrobiota bacterium]